MAQRLLHQMKDGGLKLQQTFMSQTRKFETRSKDEPTTGGIIGDIGVYVSIKKKIMFCVMIKVFFILHNQWQILHS